MDAFGLGVADIVRAAKKSCLKLDQVKKSSRYEKHPLRRRSWSLSPSFIPLDGLYETGFSKTAHWDDEFLE
jgi:hypothetical protein